MFYMDENVFIWFQIIHEPISAVDIINRKRYTRIRFYMEVLSICFFNLLNIDQYISSKYLTNTVVFFLRLTSLKIIYYLSEFVPYKLKSLAHFVGTAYNDVLFDHFHFPVFIFFSFFFPFFFVLAMMSDC